MNDETPDMLWSKKVAASAADALLDAGLIRPADLASAEGVIAEELHVRLCLDDRPPLPQG